jgi:5-methylcytosine-specific restriction endonuclease McrA
MATCKVCGGLVEPYSCSRARCALCASLNLKRHGVPAPSGVCPYCGRWVLKLTKDHIVPKSRGGKTVPENIIWVCMDCNFSKADMLLYEWLNKTV